MIQGINYTMASSIVAPSFAVVGHPNKGKSSVVSTLARDDRIGISMRSGTTTVAKRFEIKMANQSYYLVDTPGFQRPRKVLAWLQQTKPSADKRAQRIKEFLVDEQCQVQFKDEIELLAPIMDGSAILYVVDGSRPYSSDYEAEMEILRWTGQPSMALINPIESNKYVESWRGALQQYFRLVRVFDAVQADLKQHLDLLEAFRQLHLPWSDALSDIIKAFESKLLTQKVQSCAIVVKLLEDLTQYQVQQKVLNQAQAAKMQIVLQERYYHWMRQCESQAHDQLQFVYRHHHLQRKEAQLSLPDDLFDTDKWYAWGLDRSQLTKVAAIAGATTGGALDLAVAGQTFMLGALTGTVLGSSAAWFGADKLSKLKVKGLSLGGVEARQGPIKNKNFPYVVLARFLYVYKQLQNRNHAYREELVVTEQQVGQVLEQLKKQQRKDIYNALDRLSKQKPVKNLADILAPLFEES
jgi:GTPase Era involved in 16S rRNA processing